MPNSRHAPYSPPTPKIVRPPLSTKTISDGTKLSVEPRRSKTTTYGRNWSLRPFSISQEKRRLSRVGRHPIQVCDPILRDWLDRESALQAFDLALQHVGILLRLRRGEDEEDRYLRANRGSERVSLCRYPGTVEYYRRHRTVPSGGAFFVKAMQMVIGERLAVVDPV